MGKKEKEINNTLDTPFTPAPEIRLPKYPGLFGVVFTSALSGIVASMLFAFMSPLASLTTPTPPPATETLPPIAAPVVSATEAVKVPMPDAVNKAQKTIVQFYRNSKNNILSSEDRVAVGVAVTSDGWVAVPEETFAQVGADVIAITHTGEGVVKQKITDPFSHVTFVKINREDLQVVPFSETLVAGSSITQLNRTGTITFGFLTEPRHHLATTATSSEALDVAVTTTVGSESGSILFAPDGALLGITGKKGMTTPASAVREAMKLLLKKGSFTRPKLGVISLDLSALVVRNKALPLDGALLVKKGTTPAVQKKSAAETAGLKENDVITKVDSIDINADHTLSEALSLYTPGTTVTFAVWRNGAIRQITIPLP